MTSQNPLKKNAVAKIVFPIYDENGDLLPGATGLDSEYSINGGSYSDCTNEATEIGSTGMYYLNLIAGETNGDVISIIVKTTSATGKTSALVFYTSAQTLDEMDTILDIVAGDVVNIDGDAMRGTDSANTVVPDAAGVAPTAVEIRQEIDSNSTEIALLVDLLKNRCVVDVSGSQMILYADDNVTPLLTWPLLDKDGNAIAVATGVPTDRGIAV